VRYEFERPETIGTLMARVRSELGISQLRLAERVCASAGLDTVTRHEVSRWEREERIPSGFWLGWLAVALEQPLDQLERAAAAARRRRRRWPNPPPNWTECAAGVYMRIAS
jgi:transcriptional regulator with XRE-family HTH domain